MRGGIVIVADRWFASSKLCSFCAKKIRHCYYRCANGRVTNVVAHMIETLMQQSI